MVLTAVGTTNPESASAASSPLRCTINHWIRDMSQAGTPLIAVDPADNDQLIDQFNTAGYPANFIFELCTSGGLFYLENQIPAGVTHPWIGSNTQLNNAVTDTADGPGPSETFAIVCTGVNKEWIIFQINAGSMFTVVGGAPGANPPSVWDHGPVATEYQISSVCVNGKNPIAGVSTPASAIAAAHSR
jgi:hypothetical protein